MTLIENLTATVYDQIMIIQIITLILIPFAGLILIGIDRKISARMQNRIGPPILQPYYDVVKLFSKTEEDVNTPTVVFAFAHLGFMIVTASLIVFGQDMIVIFFTLTLSLIFLVLGAFSTHSPYSYLGAHRELIRILCMETLFLFVIITIGVVEGTYMIDVIIGNIKNPLIAKLPLSYAVMVLVFLVAMEKAPFDIPTAHSEIVQGPFTEYSGRWFAFFKISHAIELVCLLLIMMLFFYPNILLGLPVLFISYFIVVLIGNTTTRTTYKRFTRFSFTVGLALVLFNLLVVVLS